MPISTTTSSAKKKLPDSLHRYELIYDDKTTTILYGNGHTHAHAISREMWPEKRITDVIELDDSWKDDLSGML